jgi:hypothetical protein
MTGTRVVGKCSSGIIPTTTDLAQAAGWTVESTVGQINPVILRVGQSLESAQKENTATTKAALDRVTDTITKALTGFGTAQARVENVRQFGERSRPLSACTSVQMAAGLQNGKKSEKLVSEGICKAVEEESRGYINGSQIISAMADKAPESLTANALFPSDGAINDAELRNSKEWISLVTDPSPDLEIPPSREDTRAAKQAHAVKNIKTAGLSLPRQVLSEIAAANSPTLELGAWAQEMATQMGAEAPEGVVDGRISPNTYLTTQVNMRAANPNWHSTLNGTTDVGVLREMASMQAVSLEIQMRTLRRTEQMAALLAQMAAQQTGSNINEANQILTGTTTIPEGK